MTIKAKKVTYIHKVTQDLGFFFLNPQIASYPAFFLTSVHITNLLLLLKT